MPIDRTLLQDIATRGRAALDDWSRSRSTQTSPASRGLADRQQTYMALRGQAPNRPQTSRGAGYESLFQAHQGRLPGGGSLGTVYGQSDEGKYSGFKNASDLWAAVEGRAYGLREDEQAIAEMLGLHANEQIGSLGGEYDTALDEALGSMQAERKFARDQQTARTRGGAGAQAAAEAAAGMTRLPGRFGSGATNPELATPLGRGDALTRTDAYAVPYDPEAVGRSLRGGRGSRGFVSGDVLGSQGRQGMQDPTTVEEAAAVPAGPGGQVGGQAFNLERGGYTGALNQWLGGAVEPYADIATYADDIAQTPFSRYAEAAGAEYGVDPNIIAGKFGPAEDYRDWGLTQNLSAIDEYGMNYGDVESLMKAADAEALKAEAGAGDAGMDQVAQEVSLATGMDAGQLSDTTNMDVLQLAQIVADPSYQQAEAELATYIEDQDPDGVSEVLRTVGTQRPDIYELLLAKYGDFVPGEYDFYG